MTAPQDPFARPGEVPSTGGTPGYGTQPGGQPGNQPGNPQDATAPGYGAPPAYGAPGAPAPYGSGPGYGAPHGPARNGLGVAALVLGILALLTGFFFIGGLLGLIAIVLGVMGRGRAKRGEATNGGMATAGIVLGAIGLLFTILAAAGIASFLNSDTGQQLQDCLEREGNSQEAQQICADEVAPAN